MSSVWPHEKLIAYHKAKELGVLLQTISDKIPHARRDLRAQLERASSSILLNISEGANEFSHGDKARFYRYARRSAGECDSILDALEIAKIFIAQIADARALLRELGVILSALVHRFSRS